ncbi:MAG: hypothetical protein P1P88_00025 [Bacteroidales bacterium]|nr:hypothetical protein [Bacteroidales bacterium]
MNKLNIALTLNLDNLYGMVERNSLLLSIQRALLFNILAYIRFIFIEVEKGPFLKIWIYSDKELNESEKEIYYSVAGEVVGDFTELNNQDVEVLFFVDQSNFENIQKLTNLVYARYE